MPTSFHLLKKPAIAIAIAISFSSAGCHNPGAAGAKKPLERTTAMDWKISSPAFSEGKTIPEKYSCSGADVSPELNWTAPPEGTESLTLIMDDPDAPMGTWTHWIIYNLPPDTTHLPENIAKDSELPSMGGAGQGITSFRRPGYGGPCPPPGKPHRYFFKLYALREKLPLTPGASLPQTTTAMKGKILAETQLMGTFSR